MEPKDLLRKLHPNQFSDSKIIDKIECPRELLDFHLSKLAEQNKHFDFEDFIRNLLKREICPNLIEETGPAGGGDGKIDTENYPVSRDIQNYWWYGLNEKNDRWAFAVSLKKAWKSKCDGDIKKIIETNRGYTKIFFITNQAIKNDKKLEYQDNKSKETGVEIRVLDKTWILDKALNVKNLDLLKIINITQPLKENQIGPNDLKKHRQVEEIEKKLQDYCLKKIVNQDVIDLSIESAILSRDLEEDEATVVGKFERALRLAKEKNNIVDKRNILYDLAWYYNWWLNDDTNFEKYYIEYQNEVIKDKKIEEILKLATLWTLLYTRKNRNKNEVKDETNILLNLLNEKEKSQSRVTQLKAETQMCIINILLEENIDKQFDNLIAIVEEATRFKEYDFLTLSKMVENMLPIFCNNDKYNQLYELVTDKLSNRNCEIQRAEMYLKKSKMLVSNKKYYEAINILGKCLTFLYKEETDGKLVEAYVNIGGNFESIGLHYVAKNYYIAAITMFIDIYLKDRYLDSFSLKVINRIIDLEISNGNIEEVIEWFSIKHILLSILYESNENINFDEENDYFLQRDALISSEILNTKMSDFHLLPKIIEMCHKNGLVTSEVMAKYAIGEYDNQLLEECNGDKGKVDKLIEEFYKDSLNQKLPLPVYNNGSERTIYSFLCGNKIKIVFISSKLMHRFVEFLIALLENTFATIHTHHTYMRGDIVILLQQKNTGKFDINYSFDGIDTYTITLDSFEMYDISVENHNLITDILFKLLTNILAVNFIYEDYEKTFKEIFEDDKSFERSLNHTNSLYNLNKIFGKEEDIDIPNCSISRDKEWYTNVKKYKIKEETIEPFAEKKDIIYGVPENNPFENISHRNIYSSGMIKCNHWDVAKWKGVVYLGDVINKEFIKIGFLFENEEGAKKVFQDLIDNATKEDIDGNIVVSFIKGISKTNIYDYRVMITGKVKIPKDNSENIIINSATRFHQMNCTDDKNIRILEEIIRNENNPKITLLPMVISNQQIVPLLEYEICLKKVNIMQACEISKYDLESAAILKDDDPIIPSDMKNVPIKEVLKLKRSI
ncbi:MAG: hypothetical protein HFJ53_00940 [Clostridia bacterium]|jgi:hypothetical protein|nr:hypothetical protein [Clostridia bacterium]